VTLHPGLRRFAGQPIVVGVRPEDLRAPSDDRPGAAFVGEVEVVEALGSELLVHFHKTTPPWFRRRTPNATKGSRDQDEEVWNSPLTASLESSLDTKVRQGDTFKFSIDPIRLDSSIPPRILPFGS